MCYTHLYLVGMSSKASLKLKLTLKASAICKQSVTPMTITRTITLDNGIIILFNTKELYNHITHVEAISNYIYSFYESLVRFGKPH